MGRCWEKMARMGWLAAVCWMMTAGAAAETAFVWLGDTCASLSGGCGGLSAQVDWIVEHAQEENIRFAVHAGDIVCDWEDAQQWKDAVNVMDKLDGKVAYSLLAGYDRIGHREESYAPFVQNYVQGHRETAGVRWDENGVANAQIVDTAQGKILMLSLSRMPTVDELRWADGILDECRGIPAILMLSRYLNSGGQTGTVGAKIRNALLQRHESVRLVLCVQGEGAAWSVVAEECANGQQERTVPVLGLGASASPEESRNLWILRLHEETDSLTLESRRIDGLAAEPVFTVSTAGWF